MTAALLPLALVMLAEGALRVAGYGGYPPIIDDVGVFKGRHWYTTNRVGTDTFFSPGQPRTGGMRVLHFTTPKPPGTVRIVLLGGSAAQGFPQPLPLTNGAFLQAMLRQIWGESQRIEVLNFGATAVASFPVARFLDEVLEHDPDLVVVMAGNNEFYGAYGVASLPAALRSPAGMRIARWLGSLGVTQGLSELLASLGSGDSADDRSLMELMGVSRAFDPASPERRAAARSLQTHLTQMVRSCKDAGIPVILCTVPTNERAVAPIGAAESSVDVTTTLTTAVSRMERDAAGAEHTAREVLVQDERLSVAHFVLARALTALGRHDEALEHYGRARDLDALPWRADSAAREAILAASQHGAVLCDMENAFRDASPNGAIGWELMDDHVHLSLAGQALFAKTILRALSEFEGSLHVDAGQVAALGDWSEWADRLGRSVYTDYVAAARVRSVFEVAFMRQNNEAAYRRFDRLCRSYLDSMSAIDHKALERWRDPELHGATERPLSYVVGAFRFAQGDYPAALRLFSSAMTSVPPISAWRLQLIWYYLQCRRHLADEPAPGDIQLCREAIAIGEMLKRFGHENEPDVLRYLGLASNMAGNHEVAIENLEAALRRLDGPDAWEVVAALADSYVQTGQQARARALLQQASRDPGMAERAKNLLSSWQR
jgi:tetratricopeptide (TPR) repeat protein